jgi:hypothetical protein
MTSLSSITNFFHDDPNVRYTSPPEHTLEQSPCCPIIAVRQGYFYCRLHPEIKNVHLESIEHHVKYKDPAAHKSELLKCPNLLADSMDSKAFRTWDEPINKICRL